MSHVPRVLQIESNVAFLKDFFAEVVMTRHLAMRKLTGKRRRV